MMFEESHKSDYRDRNIKAYQMMQFQFMMYIVKSRRDGLYIHPCGFVGKTVASKSVSRVLSCTVIYLGRTLPPASSHFSG